MNTYTLQLRPCTAKRRMPCHFHTNTPSLVGCYRLTSKIRLHGLLCCSLWSMAMEVVLSFGIQCWLPWGPRWSALRCNGGDVGVVCSRETCSNENCSAEFITLMVMFKTTISDMDSSIEDMESDSDVEVKYRTKFWIIIINCWGYVMQGQ